MKSITALALTAGLLLSLPALGDERVDHFHGLPADTLEDAVANFSEYNERLATLLEKESLSPDEMHQIHELTYTLENALEKINSELADLADTLENLHVASETADTEGARRHGEAYLDTARKVIP